MKKLLIAAGTVLLGGVAFLTVSASRYQETIRPNTKVGEIEVGGLTRPEAAFKVRAWWEKKRRETIELESEVFPNLPEVTPNAVGVTLDDEATVRDLPLESFSENLQAKVMQEEAGASAYEIKFKPNDRKPVELIKLIREKSGEVRPARVGLMKGKVVRKPENTRYELDVEPLYELALNSVKTGEPLDVPLQEVEKQVPDEELAKITDLISEFKTNFNAGITNRCANIKLAASKIDGTILMPGKTFSFNGVVGRRTVEAGFKEAGVYSNGRHDTGIGGGICQVSTTLYNAALFANLEIPRRSNHSMPVPYVPVGRDATVDYGNLDLVIENTYEAPIAILAQYEPGRLTFRLLGQKQKGLSVKVYQGPAKSLPVRERRVSDPTLPKGKEKVMEKGSNGWTLLTYRNIFEHGILKKKETLGRSYYAGGIRIIAVGTKEDGMSSPPSSTTTTEGG